MFTRQLIEEIKNKLFVLGKSDSLFEETKDLDRNDFFAVVKDGENKKISVNDFVDSDGFSSKLQEVLPERLVIYENCTFYGTGDDITIESDPETGRMRIKNRTLADGGMGYIILEPNKSFVNQIGLEDTIYEVRYDFTLTDASIDFPANSVLYFNGGSLKNLNGTTNLVGDNAVFSSIVPKDKALYNVELTGDWTMQEAHSVDDEDIAIREDGKIQFKSRPYNPINPMGLGRIILRTDDTFANQVTDANTIYEIRYDFNINETVNIPANCVLDFQGGSLYSSEGTGEIVGNDSIISDSLVKIFDTNISISGTWKNHYVFPEWFGNIESDDSTSDASVYINKAIEVAGTTNIQTTFLLKKVYYITHSIQCNNVTNIIGEELGIIPQVGVSDAGTVIKVAGDIDGIIISSNGGYLWDRVIKNIQIKTVLGNTSNSHSGILLANNGTRLQVKGYIFENIRSEGFYYGMKAEGLGYYGIAYNSFTRLSLTENKIGLAIVTETYEGRSSWVNHNEFNFCDFSSNAIGGVVFYGMDSMENNFFNKCTIEVNGKNYTTDDLTNEGNFYQTYGYLGFGFYSNPRVGYGVVYFDGCYIENNYPYRKGEPTEDEYEYNGNIYPKDIETISSGIIVRHFSGVDISHCKINRNVTVLNSINSRVKMYMNDYATGLLTDYKDPNITTWTINHAVYYKIEGANYDWMYLYIDETWYNGNNGELRFKELADWVKFDWSSGYALYLSFVPIYVNTPLNEKPIEIIPKYTKTEDGQQVLLKSGKSSYSLYLGGKNKSLITTNGFCKCSTLYDFSYLDVISSRCTDDILTCYIFDTNYWAQSDSYIIDKPIVFKRGNEDAGIAIGSVQKSFKNDVTFENLSIYNNASDSTKAFVKMAGGSTVMFINCTITSASNYRRIVDCNYPINIIFNNCTFNFTSITTDTSFFITNDIYANVAFNNCTFVSINEVSVSPIAPVHKGTAENKPVFPNGYFVGFEFVNTTTGKIEIWNGVKWNESDGASVDVSRSGTTRPSGNDIYVGFMFFDTTLVKPIYASSISGATVTWVDATGATV